VVEQSARETPEHSGEQSSSAVHSAVLAIFSSVRTAWAVGWPLPDGRCVAVNAQPTLTVAEVALEG
jgi:hypothetical protein